MDVSTLWILVFCLRSGEISVADFDADGVVGAYDMGVLANWYEHDDVMKNRRMFWQSRLGIC